MSNLIITSVAIALAALASGIGVFYGGDAFFASERKAQQTSLIQASQQIKAAIELYKQDYAAIDDANNIRNKLPVDSLIAMDFLLGKYLNKIPSLPGEVLGKTSPVAFELYRQDEGNPGIFSIILGNAQDDAAQKLCADIDGVDDIALLRQSNGDMTTIMQNQLSNNAGCFKWNNQLVIYYKVDAGLEIASLASGYQLAWAAWGACSLPCGGGTQTRNAFCREYPSGASAACGLCGGCPADESRPCNVHACSGDTTPNAFDFTDLTSQAQNVLVSSNIVTISGIDTSSSVSRSGEASAEFRIAGGAWGTSGSITNGQTLQMRMTTANAPSTSRTATITVGTASDDWATTTAAAGGTSCTAWDEPDNMAQPANSWIETGEILIDDASCDGVEPNITYELHPFGGPACGLGGFPTSGGEVSVDRGSGWEPWVNSMVGISPVTIGDRVKFRIQTGSTGTTVCATANAGRTDNFQWRAN